MDTEITLSDFDDNGADRGTVRVRKLERTEDEWREQLAPEEFAVARKKATERAFTGRYWDHHEAGVYRCACCGNALFRSTDKFEIRDGLAEFPGADRGAKPLHGDGPQPGYGAGGGAVQEMRRAPGPRV